MCLCAGISLHLPLVGQVNATSGTGYSANISAVEALVNAASLNVSSSGVLVIALAPNSTVAESYTSPQTISIQ